MTVVYCTTVFRKPAQEQFMNIIITGSIAYDYLMRFPGRFTDHLLGEQLHQISLSFLVDDMTKHWGGVAANIAFNTAMLGLRTHLMGTTGRDFPDYRRWLDNVGVDTSTLQSRNQLGLVARPVFLADLGHGNVGEPERT